MSGNYFPNNWEAWNEMPEDFLATPTWEEFEDEFVKIDGWLTTKNYSNLESIFLIVDNTPFLEHDDFQIIEGGNRELTKIEWSVFFLSGYLEHGCHDVSFVGIFEN